MANITNALIVVLAVNLMLFLGQYAVGVVALDIGAPVGTAFNYSGGMIDKYDAGNNTYVLTSDDQFLPEASTGGTSVSPDDSSAFTDIFSSAKTWLSDKLGISYIMGILRAPYNFLSAILPSESFKPFVFGIGSLWYGITIFLIISWLFGRDA